MANQTNWFLTTFKRLGSESPRYFKKLFIFMASLSALSISLIALKETLSPDFHAIIDKYAYYTAIAGLVGSFMSRLPTTDTDLQSKP